MKKICRVIISAVLVLAILFPFLSQVHARGIITQHANQLLDPAQSAETKENVDSSEYAVSGYVLDDVDPMQNVDYWYDNLPTYSGTIIQKTIDADAINKFHVGDNNAKIGISIASTQIQRLTSGTDKYFNGWEGASLTSAVKIYALDDSEYAAAYGVVDSNRKLVGYVITGVRSDVSPVLEYSYDPSRFLVLMQAEKAYFDPSTGFVLKRGEKFQDITGEAELSSEEWAAYNQPTSLDLETLAEIKQEWVQFEIYATIAEATLTSSTFDSSPTSLVQPGYSTGTQTRLQMDTSDYTWLTICSYTTMTMYFDAIGRRIEPALLGNLHPHSIQLNKTLHAKYGCNLSFSEIAEASLDWANSQKLTSNLVFSNYNLDSKCFGKHKEQINKNIPTMVGYIELNNAAHIMMGIGYTSDNFYIVRDTWTNDGKPMNSTYYSSRRGLKYVVLGLDYTNQDSSTAWGSVILSRGDSNFNVRRLKIILNILYYDAGNINSNLFDEQTESAVKQFQSDCNLIADGIVGSDTYFMLKTSHIMCYDANTANWRVLQFGSAGDDVAQLQIRLYRMGYLNDDCDGIFGANTEAALKQFQTAKGLVADGIAGSATFSALYGQTNSYVREYLPCDICRNY